MSGNIVKVNKFTGVLAMDPEFFLTDRIYPTVKLYVGVDMEKNETHGDIQSRILSWYRVYLFSKAAIYVAKTYKASDLIPIKGVSTKYPWSTDDDIEVHYSIHGRSVSFENPLHGTLEDVVFSMKPVHGNSAFVKDSHTAVTQ